MAALTVAAADLRIAAAHTAATGTTLTAEHTSLATAGAHGLGQVFEHLEEQVPIWLEAAAQMEHVATLLNLQAQLREELHDTLKVLADYSPLLQILTQWAHAAGAALDFACAQAISAVCTPLNNPTPPRLCDLPLDAHHEYVLTTDPQLAEIASSYPDLRFLQGQPEEGFGFVAVIGDLDTAPTVTTFVAGTGSSEPATLPAQVDRARHIAATTGGASVLWLGYQAPATLAKALAGEPARVGGQALHHFQAELAARRPEQHRVVVGYSYGSTVVGQAAADPDAPLAADDVVLVGSPGVPQSHAAEFALSPGGHVHAMTTAGDPIDLVAGRQGGIHGTDPTATGFGARVWPTTPGDHSSYWADPLVDQALAIIAAQ